MRRAAVTTAAVLGLSGLGALGATPSSADSWVPYCGPSSYIEKIEVSSDQSGNFIIHVTPNDAARIDAAVQLALEGNSRATVIDEWHAIQNCVSGLYGDLADSIWQQLDCHQRLAWAKDPRTANGPDPRNWEWATGPTYDLESYRPALPVHLFVAEMASKCGGYLGQPPGSRLSDPTRPDAGLTDLEHAYDSYA